MPTASSYLLEDDDPFEGAKEILQEKVLTCLMAFVLVAVFFGILLWATPMAWGWECPVKAKDDWGKAVHTCSGCLRQVPHIHSVSIPALVAIPGMKPITVYNAPLCCICFRRVLIGTAKLVDVLDWAAVGEASVRKEMAIRAKSVPSTSRSTPPVRGTR